MDIFVNHKAELLQPIKGHKKGTKCTVCMTPYGYITLGKGSQFCLQAEIWIFNAKEGEHFKLLE